MFLPSALSVGWNKMSEGYFKECNCFQGRVYSETGVIELDKGRPLEINHECRSFFFFRGRSGDNEEDRMKVE